MTKLSKLAFAGQMWPAGRMLPPLVLNSQCFTQDPSNLLNYIKRTQKSSSKRSKNDCRYSYSMYILRHEVEKHFDIRYVFAMSILMRVPKPESIFVKNFAVHLFQFFDQLKGEDLALAAVLQEHDEAVDVVVEKGEVLPVHGVGKLMVVDDVITVFDVVNISSSNQLFININ